MTLDGVSAHCRFGSYHRLDGSPSIRPFTPLTWPGNRPTRSKMAEDYLMKLLDLCAELGVKVVPMFWAWPSAGSWPPAILGLLERRRLRSD